MSQFDSHEEAALARLDDIGLEVLRLSALRSGDERFEAIHRHLCVRGAATIAEICEQRGTQRGLLRNQIMSAIDEAGAQLPLRLAREEKLPSVRAIATDLAVKAIDARKPKDPKPPKLVPRRPDLRIVEGLRDGTIRRNDWRNS